MEEISHALAIPLTHLRRWSHEENWVSLVPRMTAVPVVTDGEQAKRAAERIKENREKNLAVAQRLQEDLVEVVQKLRAGSLRVVKVFANGLRAELEPGLRDRNDLALYARNVAEMSYRALGDVENARNTQGEQAGATAGQITIILPPAVAAPRQERSYDVDSEVVRLDKPSLLKDAQAPGLPSQTH